LTRTLPALGQANGKVQGKPLLDHVAGLLGDTDWYVRSGAAEAVGQLMSDKLRFFAQPRRKSWIKRTVEELSC
jgi:hypothetical protein